MVVQHPAQAGRGSGPALPGRRQGDHAQRPRHAPVVAAPSLPTDADRFDTIVHESVHSAVLRPILRRALPEALSRRNACRSPRER